jgi:uncharacterized protein YndB with AHSA1/START domain
MAENEFKITRIFNAPREMVFKAWTDPKYVMQWWGPAQFSSPQCKIDFRVGGQFLFCMQAPNGLEYWNVGIYKEIVVPEKIVSHMYFSDQDGNRLPASFHFGQSDFPDEMIDIVTFEVHDGDKTKLTLRRNHSIELATKFGEIQGWTQSLDKFEAVISQAAK